MVIDSAAERCPLCCEHGVPWSAWCGWCEDTSGGYMEPLQPDSTDAYERERVERYRCPHGKIGGGAL